LHEENRTIMLSALKDLHPRIGLAVEGKVKAAVGDAAKARALFSGMFERPESNVQKGRFAQVLAQLISDGADCKVPNYIVNAIKHVCAPIAVKP